MAGDTTPRTAPPLRSLLQPVVRQPILLPRQRQKRVTQKSTTNVDLLGVGDVPLSLVGTTADLLASSPRLGI